MQDIPKEQLIKRFQILSDSLQDIIFSETTADSIRKASVLGGVEENQGLLAELTGRVLLGYLNPIHFAEELVNELGISEETAQQITTILDAEIFSLVNTDLRKLYPPTIKTPTAMSKGFSHEEAKKYEKKDEKRVSEFEKRFLGKRDEASEKIFSQKMGSKVLDTEEETKSYTTPISEKEKIIEQAIVIPKAPEIPKKIETIRNINSNKKPVEERKPEPILAEREIKTTEPQLRAQKETPHIKPVVPLPTFLQSQFQPRKKMASAYNEDLPKEDTKNETKPTPKISGNVIDLRDL
ncbi:MAG: hypothetical protein AAB614_00975 [Patescibacteria group bacterium]